MGTSTVPSIRVKGIRDGILIDLAGLTGSDEDALAQLGAEVAQKKQFLRGSRIVLDVGERIMERRQLAAVQTLLATHELELWTVLAAARTTREAARGLGLATRLAGSNTDLEGNTLRQESIVSAATATVKRGATTEAILLRETIRSGRSIFFEGHVVIVGDVNPGAEVVAGGNVIVWGRLRGLVHAGALGDGDAVICALWLAPTQLRLADQIAIPPGQDPRTAVPEMVSIRDGQIVAEPWRFRD